MSDRVRENALSAARIKQEGTRPPSRIPNFYDRGVTLGELRTFAKRVTQWASSGKCSAPYEQLKVEDVAGLVRELTGDMSYVEMLGVGPRRPKVVVTDVWDGLFTDLVSAIDWFAEAKMLTETTVLHFPILCLNLHSCEGGTVKTLILDCDFWLAFCPFGESLIVRSNFMEQAQICFENNIPVFLGCRSGTLACTLPFEDQSSVFGSFDVDIARIFLNAKWENAVCKNEEVRQMIHNYIVASLGGLSAFAARLSRVVAGSVLRDAASRGGAASIAEIAKICSRPGFLINSSVLQGTLGETPLHIAAVVGNKEAMSALLAYEANPDAEDHIRETPLHYAAMCGYAGATKLLLSHGAVPSAESAFAETPLMVAEANPAGFLGVRTQGVVTLLRAWGLTDEDSGSRGVHSLGAR